MAYDKQAAHEYYENYTKKGKKKGRKKGSSKKSSSKTTKLIGLSTAGLNDQGKMEFALMKERLQTEMNTALKGAKTEAEKQAVRLEYQNRALQEITNIKNNPQYAKPKSTKSSKSSGSKSSGNSKSSSSSKSSSGSSSKSSSDSSSKSSSTTQAEKISNIQNELATLTNTIKSLTDAQKETVKTAITEILEKLSSVKGIDATALLSGLSTTKTEDKE